MGLLLKEHSILPGFLPGLGLTLFWLTLIVLLPLSTLVVGTGMIGFRTAPYHVVVNGERTEAIKYLTEDDALDYVVAPADATELSPETEFVAPTTRERWSSGLQRFLPELWKALGSARVLASFRVTFGTAFFAALLNLFLGGTVAYALTRVPRFPGKKVVDALVDLPFAMPTAVCGIAMATLYGPNGPVGALAGLFGIKLAFTPLGIVLAMVFIGMPFVVRTLQPAFTDLGHELEEAAESLGANRWQTWRRVLIPTLAPALLTGFTLAFARGLGEYGTVLFIAGNIPMKTEVTSLLIMTRLEQFDTPSATALALAMLTLSLILILLINRLFGRKAHIARS